MQIKILSGVSGVGKSTLTKEIKEDFPNAVVVSSDEYFMVNGEYKFDPFKLGEAHADCFKRFLMLLAKGIETIIVDNTNIHTHEISPYVMGGNAFGYESTIMQLIPKSEEDLEKIVGRNLHGAPEGTVRYQHEQMKIRELPCYWKVKTFFATS